MAVFLLYNLSNKVVVPSEGLKNVLIDIGIKKSKLKVINNPVFIKLNAKNSENLNKKKSLIF